MPRRELHALFVEAFDRPELTVDQVKALCTRKGWKTGRDGRLQKGNVPPNKGRKGMPMHPNAISTQFKPGHGGTNNRPMWSERFDTKDGYIYIKVPVTNPHTGAFGHFVHKHRWLWEREHGPIPKGHALKCLSSDKTNCDPANWHLVPRGVLPRLNGINGRNYDAAPDELKPLILAAALLAQKAAERDGRPWRHRARRKRTPA
jgi:hypothetical protein